VIADAIIGLRRDLGLEVTTKGIERTDQLAILRMNRAIHAQGYLLCRPVSRGEFLAELAALPVRIRTLLSLPSDSAAATPDHQNPPMAKVVWLGQR
jgi:predicted signal transduction protein with EAL and GGDEF domain